MRVLRIVWVLLTASLLACSSSDSSLTPADLHIKYRGMRDAVESYVNLDGKFVDGEWTEHWGDGSLFGPLYDLSASKVHSELLHYERAIEALETDRARVLAAAPNLTETSII